MKRLVLFVVMIFMAGMAWAIAPPHNPDIKIPAKALENIKSNPDYYMPGKGFKPVIARFKQQKAAFRKGVTTDDYSRPLTHASIPVLCGQYADMEPKWQANQMNQQLFGEWSPGSMTDYYREISYGQFNLTGQVYGWFQVSKNAEFFSEAFEHDDVFLKELFQLADATVDFSLFDNDGPDGIPNSGDDDGYADVVAVIHSGAGAEAGGSGIWSHSSEYRYYGEGPFQTNDEAANGGYILLNDYIMQPELEHGEMVPIGVFCHEFGHTLGLPDLYDRDDSSEGVGNWCLMAGGSYGGDGNSSDTPAHMSAWCKEMLGFIEPIVVEENLYDHLIPAVEDTGVVYKVWTKGEITPYTSYFGGGLNYGREYFLIENRQQKGFDATLEGPGLAIWHVDNSVNGQNDDELNKLVDMEEADARRDLDFLRNRGDEGDVFPGSSVNRNFNRTSNPNSMNNDEQISKVAITNISDPADSMYANIEINARDLDFLGYTMDDASGDGNGFLDPGETVTLTVELENHGETVQQAVAVLTTTDPEVVIDDSTAVIDNLLEDEISTNETDTFTITALPDAETHPVPCKLTITMGDGYTIEYDVMVMMENIFILLVDDSYREMDENNIEIIEYYESVLDLMQINYYDTHKVYTTGSPTIDDLSNYGTVIWFTGSQRSTLTADEQQALASFMDNGGDLFLISQNAGFDLVESGNQASQDFYTNYLHASYVMDTATETPQKLMTGISDEPLTKDYTPYFYASEGDGANNNTSPDIIEPVEPAVPIFNYFGTGLMGKSAAIKYDGDDYKLVYFAYSFESINEYASKNITRQDVMLNVLNYLQGVRDKVDTGVKEHEKVAKSYALHQNYPNPFNPQTTLTFELAQTGHTTLKVYNVLGNEIRTLTNSDMSAGTHEIVWDGRNDQGTSVATGVYFYRLQSGNFTEIRKMVLTR